MGGFFEAVKVFFICLFALLALFIVLLALPGSRLRSFVLEITGWGTAAASAIYVISPLDLLPDIIPVLGWGDDVVAAVTAISSILLALGMRRQRARLEEREADMLGNSRR